MASLQNLHKGGLAPARLRRVIEHIDKHLNSKLELAELARIAGFSVNYFVQTFKITTGTPPHRFIIKKRVDRAKELLRVTDKPISEIAYDVGFSGQSHFTANFRRLTGLTPAAFRRLLD